jgi:hypothetical protein
MAVTHLEIARREQVLGGAPFGPGGSYERIVGTLHFGIDPSIAVHQQIADIDRAPRNARGLVEFSADFYALRPLGGGNRRLLLDLPNRGRKIGLGMFNSAARSNDPTGHEDFGNAFLLRRGYTIAWVGWQHDVPGEDGLMALAPPRVRGMRGRLRCEFRPNARIDTLPLADRYHIPYPAMPADDPDALLTVREHANAPEVPIARNAWRFARRTSGGVVADPSHVFLEEGFEPGKIYDCYYGAEDPPVIGVGFAAVRDTAGFLRFGASGVASPGTDQLDRAYLFGISQSGRFVRHLLYLGLDEDEQGRAVFDGLIPHVAGARRGEFNSRFGQPSLSAYHGVGNLFPFTDVIQDDPLTGRSDGLLARFHARERRPKIFSINTAAEYWRGDGSLIHTDVLGERDVEPPEEVRMYLFAGCQHTPGAIPPPDADVNTGARGRHLFNTVDYSPLLRAALVNLDAWVSEGVEPPPSAVPRLADGTAVLSAATRATFAAIPGVGFPERMAAPARLDFGPDVERGVADLPPKLGAPFVTFVAAVDRDGNETAGVRPWEVRAPLAAFTGWNLRHPEQGAPGDLMGMMGTTRPFARTAAERARAGDSRPSIEERYGSRDDYLGRVRAVALEMVTARHMLAEDVGAVVERAGLLWDWIHRTSPLPR